MKMFQARRRAPTMHPVAVVLWWTAVARLVRVSFRLFYRLRCSGSSLVPRNGPLIYVANHLSHFDPPVVGSLVHDRPFASLAKSGLFSFAPFGVLIRSLGAIPLRLGRGDAAAMRAAIEQVRRGGCVLIFPEGGRSWDGSLQAFKPGVLAILRRAPATVLPVAIEGAHEIWPRGRRYPKLRGRLAVKAGRPIPGADLLSVPAADAMERLRREVETLRLELRADLRRRTHGRYPPPGPGDHAYWEARGAAPEGPDAAAGPGVGPPPRVTDRQAESAPDAAPVGR